MPWLACSNRHPLQCDHNLNKINLMRTKMQLEIGLKGLRVFTIALAHSSAGRQGPRKADALDSSDQASTREDLSTFILHLGTCSFGD